MFRILKSLRIALVIVLIISILFVIVLDFTEWRFPIYFNNAIKLNNLIYNLSISYISSFIFYFIVVHIPNEKEKQNIQPYLKNKINNIVGCTKSLLKVLIEKTGEKIVNEYPNRDELVRILSKVHPYGKSPLLPIYANEYANWITYLGFTSHEIKNYSSDILNSQKFINSELFERVVKIHEHIFIKTTIARATTFSSNKDLTFYLSDMFDFISKVKELEVYSNRKFK